MVKAIKVEKGLIYSCEECGVKLDKMNMLFVLLLDAIEHRILRCPVCFTLYSVREKDCAN